MSKLTDIKNRIDQMDGGAFQNLCDAYLSYKGYKNVYSLGMHTGTDKTAKGNPDTYFLTAENKYVFVMYTTQKTDFLKKAIEDIDKCFDSQKTGVSAEDIVEIIYCHTYGRLGPGDDKYLRQYCEMRTVVLTLIGLDQLGNDIFRECPILAQDFFGISIDSGQILPMDMFVAKHDANRMSAPLGTEFLFREKELEKAKTALHDNDVLLIAGPAGVGKTKFALELCRQLAEENGYTVFVIKNNNSQLYADLVSAVEEGKNYLVLVDDANELSGLNHVLEYLPKVAIGSRHISKLILTVRDYARKQVMQSVIEVIQPETIKISTFSDDDIRKLMETCYGITNRVYTDRIVAIAEGNARLAMLAGKFAIDSGNLAAIQDASDLYHNYYSKQLNALIESKTGVSSAGIIAFVQAIHLKHLEKLAPIFEVVGISSNDFISDLKLLHRAEIVDLCNDAAAKISDQSFSNFLIKYVFVEEKIVPLSTMIETCFQMNQSRTIEACNILLNVFSDQGVREYVEEQINLVWDKLESDVEKFLPFFRAFHMVRPTQTLLLLQEYIEQESYHPFDVRTLPFKENQQGKRVSDDILQILGSFGNHPELPCALDLLLLYFKKRPDLFEQFYSVYAERFEVNLDSPRYGYFTQSAVVKKLCEAVNATPEDANILTLFVRIASHFLKLDVSKAESGRHNTVSIYTLTLPPDQPVLEYRNMLLSQLYQIYQRGNCGDIQTEIEQILYKYGVSYYGVDTGLDVVRAEFEEILKFFSLFRPENLFHCVIAAHIKQVAKRIDYCSLDILAPFLNSEKYKIYSALALHRPEDYSDGYENWIQRHKERVCRLVEGYTPQDIDCLIQVCLESSQTFDKEESKLDAGLGYVFEALQGRKHLYLYLVDAYMKANTPYQIYAGQILEKLLEIKPVSEVQKIITRYEYDQQNVWLWFFFASMPEQQLSSNWAAELLQYLDTPAVELKSSPYRKIDSLRKYEIVEPKIIFKALRIVSKHYEDSPFIFSLYVFWLLYHSNQQEADETLREFADELPLLEEIYLKGISYSDYIDFNGELFCAIISVDTPFLYRSLDCLIAAHEDPCSAHDDHGITRLLKIWDTELYIDLADGVFDYCYYKREESMHWLYWSPVKMMLRNEASHQEIIVKQDIWIKHAIEKYYHDKDRMYQLFSAIDELSCERRRKAVKQFLSLNADPDAFERLPLEPSHWGGTGSMIPYMQERIEYLRSIFPLVSGIKYLKQKQRIEREIECWKERIHSEEVSELLEFWYY